jgi:crotonobetainyl-CoA:carnitine CoA-transferase CaiB-like acyl-CoA transferase
MINWTDGGEPPRVDFHMCPRRGSVAERPKEVTARPNPPTASGAGPLAGLKVLDMSKVLAGPLCAQYLGDMGADVTKIEPVESGDDTRGIPPVVRGGGHADGTVFLSANRNKRSIAVDLKHDEGCDLVHRLVRRSDIVIESFGPGVASRLRVDGPTLCAMNPRLIHCSISGYGSVGPMKNGKGYDAVLQSFTGLLSITGDRGGRPVRSPYSPVDQATGLHALSGILACVIERQQTGRGACIEASLFDTGLAFLGYILQGVWQSGEEPQRPGSSHDSLCPYEVFETADRPVLLGVANDSLWQKFCSVAGAEALGRDPRFATNARRVALRQETVAAVASLMRMRTRAQWQAGLDEAGVPCSPVNTLHEMLEHPHTRASGMVACIEHPAYGTVRTVAQPLRFDGKRNPVRRPTPLLGQHTDEILRELGLQEKEIHDLRDRNVVRASESPQQPSNT